MGLLEVKKQWMLRFDNWLNELAQEKGKSISSEEKAKLNLTLPPAGNKADLALGCFVLAKSLGMSPQGIAEYLVQKGKEEGFSLEAISGYVNFSFSREIFTEEIFKEVEANKDHFGETNSLEGDKIMIEFSGPNANKPLHLGHLRNNALGESLSRILKANKADVYRVNLINNRGVHICKSMLAYEKFGEGKTPEDVGKKGDHYIGDWYIRYSQYEKDNPEAEKEIQDMLRLWEAGDEKTLALWKKMTDWAIEGMKETYKRTNIHFDKIYLESDTYLLGKDEVLEGLKKGVFYKREDGAIVIDLPWHIDPETGKPQQKVLLRGDGTAIYLTQDIGNAIIRHKEYPYDSMIYVVGSEQDYHFKVLFYVLSILGYDWAKRLYHLSYGMVELPDGKMKSREGTVVDADNLLDEISTLVMNELEGRDLEGEEKTLIAESVAQGAVNYYLLNATPTKNIMFKKEESIAFVGNTGPYLQYTGVRLASLLEKASHQKELEGIKPNLSLLNSEEEWNLIKKVAELPVIVEQVAQERNPALLTRWAYGLCKSFNQFYQEQPVIVKENVVLTVTRLDLCEKVLIALKKSMELLNIPVLKRM